MRVANSPFEPALPGINTRPLGISRVDCARFTDSVVQVGADSPKMLRAWSAIFANKKNTSPVVLGEKNKNYLKTAHNYDREDYVERLTMP